MSDFREEIADIIRNSIFYMKNSNNNVYCYPDIPEKMIKKVRKNISADINVNTTAAIVDSTLLKSGKEGAIFTTTGVYFKQMFMKKNYFNYADVVNIYKGNVYIQVDLSNGVTLELSDTEYDASDLIRVINKLREYTVAQGLSSRRESGNLKKVKMPQELTNKCHAIIHAASAAAGGVGAGLAQLPCSDAAVITPIQISMIVGLGEVFDLHITDGTAKGIIAGMTGAFVGRGVVQIAVGWIPGAGNAINTATAAGLTEAIGWAAASQFYKESLDNCEKYSYEGEKRGYAQASEVYEKKMRDQAAEFLSKIQLCEEEKAALNALIDDYEKYINEHLNDENVNEMRAEYNNLIRLRC